MDNGVLVISGTCVDVYVGKMVTIGDGVDDIVEVNVGGSVKVGEIIVVVVDEGVILGISPSC